MNFEDYLRSYNCVPLEKTEQSWTFTSIRDGKKRFVKKYPSNFDRAKEELAYAYIDSRDLLNISQPTIIGEDFIEMEFLDSVTIPNSREIVEGISKMYIKTLNNPEPERYFPRIDLSKNKLLNELSVET